MNPSKSLMAAALISVTAAATALLIQACGGGGAMAQVASDADPIEGVWESTLTVKDCASSAVLTTFKGLAVLHRGGTLSADNSRPTFSRGTAYGTWKHGTGNTYTSTMVFMRFNPDATLAGSQKVVRSFALAADGNSLTGNNTAQIINTAGVILQQACISETGVQTSW
ncbi:hypothetical protein BH11PSE10_BH11PSE10_10810 [soil metagenome]